MLIEIVYVIIKYLINRFIKKDKYKYEAKIVDGSNISKKNFVKKHNKEI